MRYFLLAIYPIFHLALIAVSGSLSAEEVQNLTDRKNVKFTPVDASENDSEEEKHVKITDEELTLSSKNRDLIDVLDMVESRERHDMSLFKPVIDMIKKNEKQTFTLFEKIQKGIVSFFLIFTDKLTNGDCANLRILREKEIPYFISSDEKIAKKLGLSFPCTLAFNAQDNILYKTEKFNIGIVLTPLLSTLTTENMKYLDLSTLPPFYIFLSDDEKDSHIKKSELRKIALQYKEIYKFALIKYIKGQTDLSHFGIDETHLPSMVHVNEKREKFVLNGLTVKNVENFLKKFQNKEIEPFMRSESTDAYKDGPLKYLVGKNHNEFIQSQGEKDLLVIYGSARCPHCVKLLPTLIKLAGQLKETKTVEVAYIDLEKNDVTVKIEAFPTIMLYPGNSEKDLETRGQKYADFSRTENAFKKFIKENGTANKDMIVEEELESIPELGDIVDQLPPVDEKVTPEPVQEVKEEL